MKKIILLLLLTIPFALNNCDDNPIELENNSPVILSLTVFPEIVEPNDSLIVICNATDSDGDTLVYDWYTTGVVKIKGALPGLPALFNTTENSRIFYAPDSIYVSAPQDTFWIECAARDGKGGQVSQSINFIVVNSFSLLH
jgi:hypothetical protein